MAKFISVRRETRPEFLSRARKCLELVVVHGPMDARYGPQSLQTVLDKFTTVLVQHPTGWTALLAREGHNGFKIVK